MSAPAPISIPTSNSTRVISSLMTVLAYFLELGFDVSCVSQVSSLDAVQPLQSCCSPTGYELGVEYTDDEELFEASCEEVWKRVMTNTYRKASDILKDAPDGWAVIVMESPSSVIHMAWIGFKQEDGKIVFARCEWNVLVPRKSNGDDYPDVIDLRGVHVKVHEVAFYETD
jgi:hypothetical protein